MSLTLTHDYLCIS